MPRSNPHARERVMDDEKHLDVLARSFPFAGRETSGASSAGCGVGGLSKLLRRQSVTKRCSRRVEWGLTPLSTFAWERFLDSGLSARAGDASRSQERWSRRTHGSLSRPRRRSARDVDEREPERRDRPVVRSEDESRSRPMAIRSPWNGPRACGAHRSSEEPTFRKGRAHDRFDVAEVGRTASSSWTRAAPGNRGGVPKRNAPRETSRRE